MSSRTLDGLAAGIEEIGLTVVVEFLAVIFVCVRCVGRGCNSPFLFGFFAVFVWIDICEPCPAE